jgi:hypothetical protein
MDELACRIGVFSGGPEISYEIFRLVKCVESAVFKAIVARQGCSVLGTIVFGSPRHDFMSFGFERIELAKSGRQIEFVLNVPFREYIDSEPKVILKCAVKIARLNFLVSTEDVTAQVVNETTKCLEMI